MNSQTEHHFKAKVWELCWLGRFKGQSRAQIDNAIQLEAAFWRDVLGLSQVDGLPLDDYIQQTIKDFGS